MHSLLLVEIVATGRFQGGWTFPFVQGWLRSRGHQTRWLRFGVDPSVQARNEESGISLEAPDLQTLLDALDALTPDRLLLSCPPSERLRAALLEGRPDLEIGILENLGSALSTGAIPSLPASWNAVTGWLGVEAGRLSGPEDELWSFSEPDYQLELSNALARSQPPLVHLLVGNSCLYRRPLLESTFFASQPGEGLPEHWGCSFCSTPQMDRSHLPSAQDAATSLLAQLRCVARTLEPREAPVRYRVLGARVSEDPEILGRCLDECAPPPGAFLLDYRADRIVSLEAKLLETARKLEDRGFRLDVCLIGLESFASAQLDRFAKGYDSEVNLACVETLRRLEQAAPEGFGFREYGGLSTILFDPFVSLGEVALNLALVQTFELEKLCGKLLGSRLRLQPGLPLLQAVEQAGLVVDRYEDPWLDTARRNFYSNEVPWTFADPRLEPVCQLLTRLEPEGAPGEDPLSLEVVAFRSEHSVPPLTIARAVVEAAAASTEVLAPGELLRQAGSSSRLLPDDQPARPTEEPEIGGQDADAFGAGSFEHRLFDRGLKPILKIEGHGTDEELEQARDEARSRWPEVQVSSRRPEAPGTTDWNLFLGRNPEVVSRALTAGARMEQARNDTEEREAIREIGQLLGYPTCCTEHYSDSQHEIHTVNEWGWVRLRSEGPERFDGVIHPFLTTHLPCSLDCAATHELVEAVYPEGLPDLSRQPTLVFFDRPGETVLLEALDPPADRFRYRVASWHTSHPKLAALQAGDTLLVEPGLIRILSDDREIGHFALDAFLWWSERRFHPEFWKIFLERVLAPHASLETVSPVPSPRDPLATALEALLGDSATALAGFTPVRIESRQTGTGWGEIEVELHREEARLRVFLQPRQEGAPAYRQSREVSLIHARETPPDTRELTEVMEHVLHCLQQVIESQGT